MNVDYKLMKELMSMMGVQRNPKRSWTFGNSISGCAPKEVRKPNKAIKLRDT